MCAISSLICIAVETTVVAAEEIIGERERAILVRTTGDFSIYIDVVDRLKKDRNVIRAYFACVLYRSSKGQTSYSIKKKKKKKKLRRTEAKSSVRDDWLVDASCIVNDVWRRHAGRLVSSEREPPRGNDAIEKRLHNDQYTWLDRLEISRAPTRH